MKKKYFTLLLLSVFYCFVQAQTTHFIDWDISVGANASITIDVGDTIEWTNVDNPGMIHNVVSNDPNAPVGFGSGTMNVGDTYSFTFNSPVVFDYLCGFHPGSMDGTITVLAAATCDPPSNLMLNNVTDTTADLSWIASPDETGGYNWAVMADGEHPSTHTPVQSGSTLTGVTNTSATGLVANTDYDFFVQTDCGATTTSTWAGPLSFTTDVSPVIFPAPYCGPITFEFGIEPITHVAVAGIANSSSAVVGGIAHEDYTGITGTMEQGASYTIALEGNTDGNWQNFFTVFIDWNQNDLLDDSGEMYQIGSITNSTGTDGQQATGVISVPVGATLGQTRMRVFKVYEVPNGFVTDPCSMTQNFGQVEDYTIEVIPAGTTTCDTPTNLTLSNVTDTTADFSWTASPDETGGYAWVVMLMGDDPNTDPPVAQGTVSTGTIAATATGLTPDTMYQAYVKTFCALGIESNFSTPLHILTDEEVCEALTDLTVNDVTETIVSFSWTEPVNTSNILGYGVIIVLTGDVPFVDNHVAEEFYNVGVASAAIPGLQPVTTYDLYMASVCSMVPLIISDFEMMTFTTDEGMNVIDNERISLRFFPNPTSGILTLDAPTVIEIVEVFNLKGQMVLESRANQQSIQLDLSDLAQGIYMLKASFEGGSVKALRIIKE